MIAHAISALREALRPFQGLGPVVRKFLIALLQGACGAFCTGVFSSLVLYIATIAIFRPVPQGLEGHRKLLMSLLTGAFTGVCAGFLIAFTVLFVVASYCIFTYVVRAFRQNFSAERQRFLDLKKKLPQPLEPFCPETEAIHALEKMLQTDNFFYRVLYRFSVDDRLWKMEIDFALSALECRLARQYLNGNLVAH